MESKFTKGESKEIGKPVERHLSEEETFFEVELLTTIMNVSSTAMIVLNPLGQIRYANPASESVLGIKLNDILSRTYDAPEWKNTSLDGGPWREEDQPFNVVLKTKKPVTDIRHAIEDASGNKKYLSINGSPVFDKSGEISLLVFLITDITENVVKQKKIEYDESKYRTITELSLSMVYDMDVQTGENIWGGAIQEITGYSEDEYQKFGYKEWLDCIHQDDRETTLQAFEEALSNHKKFTVEYRYKTKTGKYIYIEDNGIFLYNEKGEAYRMFGAMIDRTKQIEANIALKESESRLVMALDAAKMGIWSWDIKAKTIYWSPQTYRIYGFPGENFEVTENLFLELTHKDDLELLAKETSLLMEDLDRTAYRLRNRINHPDGKVHWVEALGKITRSEDGTPINMRGTVLDITEIKLNEEALRISDERFEAFYQFSTEAFLIFDENGLIAKDSNFAFQKLFGYDLEDTSKLKIRNLLSISSLRKIREMIAANRTGSIEIVCRKKNGDFFPALVSIKRFLYKNSNSIAYSIFDLSPLKEVEELRLINSEIRDKNDLIEKQKLELESAFENLKRTQEQLIQSEKLAALGQLIAGIAHEINNPIGAVKASNQNMLDWQKRYGLASQLFREAILSVPQTEQKIVKSILANLDQPIEFYTGREERLRKKRNKEIFLADGFDLRSAEEFAENWVELGIGEIDPSYLPLFRSHYIKVFLDYLSLEIQFRRNTRSIQLAVDRVSKIMYALKNFSHFDTTGKKNLASIPDTIETVLTIYQNQLKRGINLVKDFDPVAPIECYPDDLLHVWTNLIYNALQAMSFDGNLEIAVKDRGSEILVSLKDSGPGIPKEIQSKIFEPFFTTKAPGEGSGLGLDIVNKIVKRHAGRIELTSVPGETIFFIYLPKQS
ncbi:PAS domain S-box protein [Leptospira bandrabouensis]|uniref:histidine kinase n=2 Tax=Leptospira bandrabouensis TaxID=2484903 RepID=A0A6H3NPH8_9LEPT|nr:PAS domain S-box protein [Leptospira bandrabouensis]MCG6152996.1 PAS domain S-box protein [Leptospira bandrabouensis]MCW7459342.1 PAS domain S-box protein [Leptospira bandrabouensis]MCW7478225.1 PAS domain S-box protein [Leptospira bandrabouensis]MCW7485653.1 PAS domain S-box protein [Leptospira bandrabouensis]TGN03799.1 PAS domain S-box protein [Leptospira bandrabouensis]